MPFNLFFKQLKYLKLLFLTPSALLPECLAVQIHFQLTGGTGTQTD